MPRSFKNPELRSKRLHDALCGRSLKERGHKTGCPCRFCMASRGELVGIKSPGSGVSGDNNPSKRPEVRKKISMAVMGKNLNKSVKDYHKKNCQCGVCKAIRREYVGINNPAYGKSPTEDTKEKISKTITDKIINNELPYSFGSYYSAKKWRIGIMVINRRLRNLMRLILIVTIMGLLFLYGRKRS